MGTMSPSVPETGIPGQQRHGKVGQGTVTHNCQKSSCQGHPADRRWHISFFPGGTWAPCPLPGAPGSGVLRRQAVGTGAGPEDPGVPLGTVTPPLEN